jgi:hypothetical protein
MSVNDQDKKMDDDAHIEEVPATSQECSEIVFDPDFNDPSDEIVLKSSDNLLFRVGANHLTVNR